MKTEPFRLPEEVETRLAEIFTEQHMNAVRSACERYLRESREQKPSIIDDGKVLTEISEKASELRDLLKRSETALERVHLHIAKDFGKHDGLFWVEDLKERLRILDNMCFVNPARERAENPRRGATKGNVRTPERALAFRLWDIYRIAHGKPAKRVVNVFKAEVGPLPTAIRLLGPVLKINSDFSRYFREIRTLMDNKSK